MADARVWAERVAAWRESGQSADAFASGRGFAGATLRWWSSRLGRRRAEERAPTVRLARVVRSPEPSPLQSTIIVEIGRGRVLVPPGVDAATLATVLSTLGGVP
jgi:hypothetical protein